MKKLFVFVASAFLLGACAGSSDVAEVRYSIWLDWPERNLPDFSTLGKPDVTGVKRNIDMTGLPDTLNHFAVLLETELKVAKAEEYTFTLTTDDGSKLYVDGEMIIVNDGAHGPIKKEAVKQLSKGKHDIKVEFFDYDKGQSIYFTYSTPTIMTRQFDESVKKEEEKRARNDSFVKPQIEEALKRYLEWKGDDETLVFPMVTDIHTSDRFSYLHIGYAARVADAFNADFMVNFGDIGLNAFPASSDSVYAQTIIDNIRKEMDKYDGIWLYTPGNHDFDGGAGRKLDEAYLSRMYQQPWQKRAGANLHIKPGRAIGYYDLPEKGFRVIFLNSQGSCTRDGKYYYFDDAQLDWLQGTLDSTPEGRHVIVLAHYTPVIEGRWSTYKQHPESYYFDSDKKLMAILSKYAATHPVSGFYSGDSHFNFHVVRDGVDYFTSQGYGWATPELLSEGSKRAYFEYTESLCIDVVAVKPGSHKVHTFRVGAGGAKFDYLFDY